MAQRSRSPQDLLPQESHADSDHKVLPFPTRFPGFVPPDLPVRSAGRQATRRPTAVSTRAIRQVVVIGAAGRLGEVIEDVDREIQLALADEPRGVVCDLSAVLGSVEPVAVEVLATAGRHVRDWPGIPVGVACPDPQVREALKAHPLGRNLIVTDSLFSAISAVLGTPTLAVKRLRLAPHPTAPRAAGIFVARVLRDWQLDRVVPFASLVVSELVASSSVNAGTDIDVSVVWNLGTLRLAVRDHGPGLPDASPDHDGRGLTAVAGLSCAFGVLPTASGGKVVWAVLDVPRRRPLTSRRLSSQECQEALILDEARAPVEHCSRIIKRWQS